MFWQRNLVSDDMAEWVHAGFARLIRDMGVARFLYDVRLVQPTRAFFKARPGHDHATAMFCHLKGIGAHEVEPHLDGFLTKRFRRGVQQLAAEAETLRALEAMIDGAA